jgi:nucleoside-diphosphate-sugar epimerase
MKKVLLTGASGFVGKQIIKALSESNVHIIPVIRPDQDSKFQDIKNITYFIKSLDIFKETTEWWIEKCNNIDIIIHAAWYAEPGKYVDSPKNVDCMMGSFNLAKGAAKAGVKRFVGIGTCLEYDLTGGAVSIHTPLKPLSPYANTKAELFTKLSQCLPKKSVEFVWCRLFYLYGEGENERRLVSYLHKQIANGEIAELTSGNQIRDYLDVSEAGRLISNVALSGQLGPVNICSGVPITIREFAEQIADKYGRRDLLRFDLNKQSNLEPFCVVGIK